MGAWLLACRWAAGIGDDILIYKTLAIVFKIRIGGGRASLRRAKRAQEAADGLPQLSVRKNQIRIVKKCTLCYDKRFLCKRVDFVLFFISRVIGLLNFDCKVI
jgi:hypothetical protein